MFMLVNDLIRVLQDAQKTNGTMAVAVCVDGAIRDDIEINCEDSGDALGVLYIEGYRSGSERTPYADLTKKSVTHHPYMIVCERKNVFINCFYAVTFSGAKELAESTMREWMAEEAVVWDDPHTPPSEPHREYYNRMIRESHVEVRKYNATENQYEIVWTPSPEDMVRIGWAEI